MEFFVIVSLKIYFQLHQKGKFYSANSFIFRIKSILRPQIDCFLVEFARNKSLQLLKVWKYYSALCEFVCSVGLFLGDVWCVYVLIFLYGLVINWSKCFCMQFDFGRSFGTKLALNYTSMVELFLLLSVTTQNKIIALTVLWKNFICIFYMHLWIFQRILNIILNIN